MITLKHIAKHTNVSHPRIVHKLKSIKELQCPPLPLGEIKAENEQIKQIRSSSKRTSLTFSFSPGSLPKQSILRKRYYKQSVISKPLPDQCFTTLALLLAFYHDSRKFIINHFIQYSSIHGISILLGYV